MLTKIKIKLKLAYMSNLYFFRFLALRRDVASWPTAIVLGCLSSDLAKTILNFGNGQCPIGVVKKKKPKASSRDNNSRGRRRRDHSQ